VRDLRGRGKTEVHRAQFSTRDGVSWVLGRFNIFKGEADILRGKDRCTAVDGKVYLEVVATALVEGSNDTLVVQVDDQVNIFQVELLEKVDNEFKGNSFKPANVTQKALP
jgi:hypothetical protein